jgi:hypothetical protein
MILERAEKIHVVERRYFPDDIRRHFCGGVVNCSEYLIRAVGYVWVFSTATNQFVRKPEKRERIFCLGDRLTISIVPKEVNIEDVRYIYDRQQGHLATDGKKFILNISEFGIIS